MTAHLSLSRSEPTAVVALHCRREDERGRDIRQMGEELTAHFNRSATPPAPTRVVALPFALAVHAHGAAALIHTSCRRRRRRRRRRCQPKVEDWEGRRQGERERERGVRLPSLPPSLLTYYSVEITVWELVVHMRPGGPHLPPGLEGDVGMRCQHVRRRRGHRGSHDERIERDESKRASRAGARAWVLGIRIK